MNDILVNDYSAFAPRASFEASNDSLPIMRLNYPRALTFTSDQNGAPYDPETGQRINDTRGGSVEMCGACTTSQDCFGNTGRYGSVFCEALGDANVCLKDCTNVFDSCPEGTNCSNGSCRPESGACTDQFPPCGEAIRTAHVKPVSALMAHV